MTPIKPGLLATMALTALMSPGVSGEIEVTRGQYRGPDKPPPKVPPYNPNKSTVKHQTRSAEAIKRRRLKRLRKAQGDQ